MYDRVRSPQVAHFSDFDTFGFGVTHIDSHGKYMQSHMTSLDIWQDVLTRFFWTTSITLLSRRGFSSPKASRRIRKDNPSRVSMALLPPRLLLHAFYFMALSVNCRRIGSSTGSPACCAPPGDELLLSRASRSRGLTLCGLSSRRSGLEKPK